SIVIRSNGDVYVACYPTSTIYRYDGGDASRRKTFASFPGNSGNPLLQFNLDESALYFTSYTTGNLIGIDPDTAAWTTLLPGNSLPGAGSIAVFGPRKPASWTNYDTGFAGTNGI